jgi:hypothetical protein
MQLFSFLSKTGPVISENSQNGLLHGPPSELHGTRGMCAARVISEDINIYNTRQHRLFRWERGRLQGASAPPPASSRVATGDAARETGSQSVRGTDRVIVAGPGSSNLALLEHISRHILANIKPPSECWSFGGRLTKGHGPT